MENPHTDDPLERDSAEEKALDELAPMAEAMKWVSRITTVALEMVLPGLLGTWLDNRWNTKFIALIGFGLGVSTGIFHLVLLGRETDASAKPKKTRSRSSDPLDLDQLKDI